MFLRGVNATARKESKQVLLGISIGLVYKGNGPKLIHRFMNSFINPIKRKSMLRSEILPSSKSVSRMKNERRKIFEFLKRQKKSQVVLF